MWTPPCQGRSLFSLKTLKIPDLFSFFSFFFSLPFLRFFRAGLTLTFRFLGNRVGLTVCPRAQRAQKLSDGLKKTNKQVGTVLRQNSGVFLHISAVVELNPRG